VVIGLPVAVNLEYRKKIAEALENFEAVSM